jgi:DNA segregation ATPase FtsK/SpoIIIE, S-DNA-T family
VYTDDLLARIKRANLGASEGGSLAEPESTEVRAALAAYARDHAASTANTRFSYWLDVWADPDVKVGLGDQVRQELASDPNVVSIFDELGVLEGLNAGEPDQAQLTVEVETDDGSPLLDHLSTRLRRRVEKLAAPKHEAQQDPLRALVEYMQGLSPDEVGEAGVALEVDPRQEAGACTQWLFGFLYGRTLQAVAEESELGGVRFRTTDVLQPGAPCPFLPRSASDGEDEEDPDADWEPLRLALRRVDDQRGALYRFAWRPESIDALGLGARLLLEPDLAFPLHATGFEEVARTTVRERQPLPARGDPPEGLAGEWLAARAEALAELSDGLDEPRLQIVFDHWTDFARRAAAELIPQSAPLPALETFLDVDVLHDESTGRRAWLLASHPLRLRWLAAHLRHMREDMQAALTGTFALNSLNERFYFERLARVSPHRQPPVFVFGDRVVATPVRELGLHEEYAALQRGDLATDEWLASMDDASIDQLVGAVRQYVDAFPHKVDGLSLLLVDRVGDADLAVRLARRLASLTTSAVKQAPTFELRVLAPRFRHGAIARAVATVEDDASPDDRLLPRIQLALEPYEQATAVLEKLSGRVDLAFVPDLFSAETTIVNNTRRVVSAGAQFDPWLDSTTYTESLGGSSQNVARRLLPKHADVALEAWSTLMVRRRQRIRTGEDGDAVEYFEVQVRFDRSTELFRLLHEVAQWVVTLDPFIGREQIDALEERPDIIVVRAGVGKNEAYTLVISSWAGRAFVTTRLAAKLSRILDLPAEEATLAATRLYDLGRNTAPGIMLRALGLGRSTEEIIGTVTSRYTVEEAFAFPNASKTLEWWLSLDQHIDWFGGPRRPRADMLRATFAFDGEQVALQLDVIESKFRTQLDLGSAERQVETTVALLREALDPTASGHRADRAFWQRELLRAFGEASRIERPRSELPELIASGIELPEAEDRVRQALTEGAYTLEVRGIVVATQSAPGEVPLAFTSSRGLEVVPVGREELLRVIGAINARRSPQADAREPEGPIEPVPEVSVEVQPADLADTRGIGRAALIAHAQLVIDVLAEHNVRVRPAPDAPAVEGPGFYVLRFEPERGVTVDKIANRAQEIKLGLKLPADLELRTYVDRGSIVVEVPKIDDERYGVDARRLWQRVEDWPTDRLWTPIGEDIRGEVVPIDLSNTNSPHLLIGGTTGSGKSVALETILRGMTVHYAPDRLRLVLIDPKGTELVDFEGSTHVSGEIGIDADDAIHALTAAVDEMQHRYVLMKERRSRSLPDYNAVVEVSDRLPWRVVVLDEYADLTSDPDDKKETEALLQRLAQKARAAGIHVVVATQRPTADVISTTIRSNLPAQLALRVRSGTESRVILGEPGAESLAGKGDAFLKTASGMTRVQCARFEPAL